MADTLGSLIDKLATVNNKLFLQQELIYEIRRMDFEQFYTTFGDAEGMKRLYLGLHKLSDLNLQRTSLVTEVDRAAVELMKRVANGENIDDGKTVVASHKTIVNG